MNDERGLDPLPAILPDEGPVLLVILYSDACALVDAAEVARKTCREGRAGRFVVRIRRTTG